MAIVYRKVVLLLTVALAGSCSFRSEPERVVEAYAQAINENRCDDALKLISERTRHAVDVLRVKPQHPQNPLPIEYYYCNKLVFNDCKLGKMTLSASNADSATVSMPCGHTQDSILPGFSSPFLKYEPRLTELVRENGGWHIVEPMVIRIAEIGESEDRMRDAALERQRLRRRSPITASPQ